MATGRLYKRGKVWYLDVYTGRKKADGKRERIQRKSNGLTKKEAQLELDEMLYQLRRSKTVTLDNKYPLLLLSEKWICHIDRTISNPKVARACRHESKV